MLEYVRTGKIDFVTNDNDPLSDLKNNDDTWSDYAGLETPEDAYIELMFDTLNSLINEAFGESANVQYLLDEALQVDQTTQQIYELYIEIGEETQQVGKGFIEIFRNESSYDFTVNIEVFEPEKKLHLN